MSRDYIPNPEGKGFVKTGEEKEQQKIEKQRRLGIIEKIITEEGFKNIPHLNRKLEENYDIDVTRQCTQRDIDEINRRGKHYKRTATSILASYRAKMQKIDRMIKKEDNAKEMRLLYKLWSKFAKDYATVSARLGATAEGRFNTDENDDEPISISFEDD